MHKQIAGLLSGVALTLFAALATAEDPELPVITLWVFPHDDLAALSDQQIKEDFLDNWVIEMGNIVDYPIQIRFQRQLPGVTDVDYENQPSSKTLSAWVDASWKWRRLQNSQGGLATNKYLLLTREAFDRQGINRVLGLAEQAGHAAIASTTAFTTAGHELGHLFNATHEQSDVNFNGWFCETYMFPARLGIRSNCYRYTDANRDSIAQYLNSRLAS